MHRSEQSYRPRHVVGGRGPFPLVQKPQAVLRERQRRIFSFIALRRQGQAGQSRGPVAKLLDGGGQFVRRGRLEEVPQGNFYRKQLLNPCQQTHGGQRMTAGIEKAVVGPNRFETQHIRPQQQHRLQGIVFANPAFLDFR